MIDWANWPVRTKVLAALSASGLLACLLSLLPSLAEITGQFAKPIAPKISSPQIVALPPPPPVENYAEIIARPLFNFDRKPDPLAPVQQQAAKPAVTLGDLAQIKLLGLVTSGATRLALVRRADSSTLTLRVGDLIEGWIVDQISVQGVAFKGGDRVENIKIPAAENRAASHGNIRAGGE